MDVKNKIDMEALEKALRAGGGTQLSPQFKRGVLDAIAALPSPQLAARPRPALALVAFGVLLLLAGAFAMLAGSGVASGPLASFAPGFADVLARAGDWLAAWQWELSDTTLALQLGEGDTLTLSASLLTLLAVAAGAAFMAFAGYYTSKHRLIGA